METKKQKLVALHQLENLLHSSILALLQKYVSKLVFVDLS